VIDPQPGSIRYEAEGPDGPGVGFLSRFYRTTAVPETITRSVETSCKSLGLMIRAVREQAGGERVVSCSQGDLLIVLSVTGQDVAAREDISGTP
jgi:hypothetical protein